MGLISPSLDSLVLSPGVPLTHPEPHWTVVKAKAAGIEIIGDTEVFQREVAGTGARIVAITGTNGKSTTTALIGHIFKASGTRCGRGRKYWNGGIPDATSGEGPHLCS